MTKRCLICENEIAWDAIAVHAATIWTSHGNYGSTVYDPINGDIFLAWQTTPSLRHHPSMEVPPLLRG